MVVKLQGRSTTDDEQRARTARTTAHRRVPAIVTSKVLCAARAATQFRHGRWNYQKSTVFLKFHKYLNDNLGRRADNGEQRDAFGFYTCLIDTIDSLLKVDHLIYRFLNIDQ